MGLGVSGEDIDIADLFSAKGVLKTLFASMNGRQTPAAIETTISDIRMRRERKTQSRDREKKREQQKQGNNKSDRTDDLSMYAMLSDIARTIEANNERLRVLERQQEALAKHLALLLAGVPVELYEDGKLKDADAEVAVQEYEKVHDTTVDRTDPVQIQAVHEYGEGQKQAVEIANRELIGQFVEAGGDISRIEGNFLSSNSGPQEYQGAPAGPVVDGPKL